jgi:hypothetical protein
VGCLSLQFSFGQKINHVDFDVTGSTVKINYDIESCSDDRSYDVRLLLGIDGRLTEIKRGLSGDLKNVPCGAGKTILWNVLTDREGLSGRIYFAVEIINTHDNDVAQAEPDQEVSLTRHSDHSKDRKEWAMRSWKADKGYAGGSIGVFAPFQTYTALPYNSLLDGGAIINVTMGYLPTLLLGVSATVYVYSDPERSSFDINAWKNYGFMVGPLLSLPIGNRVKWEMRPQIGYSAITERSELTTPDSLSNVRAGVSYSLGTGLRLNIGKRTCYMMNVEYMSAPIRLDDYTLDTRPGTVGVSFGVAFRFY